MIIKKHLFEVWMPVKGYEELYEISNFGRVKSLPRKVIFGNVWQITKEKILTAGVMGKGYNGVVLSKNNKKKKHYIHRLVAQAFLPNPNNYPEVNHKDENKQNNFVWINPDGNVDQEKSNLEWCSHKKNCNHGSRNDRVALKNTNGKKSKAIIQYTLSGDYIKEWPSQKEVERTLGIFHNSIAACCKGKIKQTGGYIWKYKN